MREILEKDYIVDSRDSDMFGYLRTSSLLGFMQDIATNHAADLGISRETLMEGYGAFWMMTRMWLRLNRPIGAFERVTIRTWHRGAHSATVHRDFDILAGEGAVGEAVTNWIIIGRESRRILKPAAVAEFAASVSPQKTKDIRPGKIVAPEGMNVCATRTVRYSDTDINGHMNNAGYADIACDSAGMAELECAYVSEMQIGYLSECFPGEEIIILKGERDGDIYVSGVDDVGKSRFDVRLKLSEK